MQRWNKNNVSQFYARTRIIFLYLNICSQLAKFFYYVNVSYLYDPHYTYSRDPDPFGSRYCVYIRYLYIHPFRSILANLFNICLVGFQSGSSALHCSTPPVAKFRYLAFYLHNKEIHFPN